MYILDPSYELFNPTTSNPKFFLGNFLFFYIKLILLYTKISIKVLISARRLYNCFVAFAMWYRSISGYQDTASARYWRSSARLYPKYSIFKIWRVLALFFATCRYGDIQYFVYKGGRWRGSLCTDTAQQICRFVLKCNQHPNTN